MPSFNELGYGVAANPGGTGLDSLSTVTINGVDYEVSGGSGTVTEAQVTAHQAALSITESQISDLSHFSGAYADLTGKPSIPTNNNELTNGAGYVTTDTNTQLSDADIAAMGYIKTDTNTQLSDSEIAALGYIKTDTNTQLSDSDIAALGYIKTYTDTNTQLSDQDITDLGYIKTYTDTNTQLSDSDIAAFGYIKTDTNTQLSDSDIAALGYIKTDTNTQLSDSDIAALGYIKTDTNTQRTDAEIDARIALNPEGFITSYVDTNTQLSDSDIAAFGYIKTDTNTQLSDTDISNLGYIKDYTVTESDVADHTESIATSSGAVNFNSGVNHHLSVSGSYSLTLSNISGNEGKSGVIVITNSAATSTPTMPTEFKTPNGDTAVWNNTSGNTAMLSYYIVNSTTILTNYIGNFS